ncbi:hypothetical protein, partial [Blastochloris sulfoviridis]
MPPEEPYDEPSDSDSAYMSSLFGIAPGTAQGLESASLSQALDNSSLGPSSFDPTLFNIQQQTIDTWGVLEKAFPGRLQLALAGFVPNVEFRQILNAITTPGAYIPSSIFDVQVLGFGGFSPVLLDLSGDGVSITELSASNTWYDTVGDGYQHRTAWAGAGDGVLVYDTHGDGQITQANQVAFTLWDPTAASDIEALRDVFDTDHDGTLDADDANFTKFKVLVTNADGTQTLKTLAELGIASIDLNENAASVTLPDGSSIDGTTTFTRTDGSTGEAATVTLATDAQGYKIERTVTRCADGSTTIDTKARAPDGSLANETITV